MLARQFQLGHVAVLTVCLPLLTSHLPSHCVSAFPRRTSNNSNVSGVFANCGKTATVASATVKLPLAAALPPLRCHRRIQQCIIPLQDMFRLETKQIFKFTCGILFRFFSKASYMYMTYDVATQINRRTVMTFKKFQNTRNSMQ